VDEILQAELDVLKEKGLYRSLRTVQSGQGREIIYDGHRVLNFCSNDYLGLANHPRIILAVEKLIKDRGFGAGASRLVCGNFDEHGLLETAIASFKKTQAALVFSSGYMANVGIISSIAGRGDVVFSDRLNHASIVDGIISSRAELKRYPHCDMSVLEEMLTGEKNECRKLIVTDTVFSMDGDVAPLLEITALAKKYNAWVMVDEAHAFGLFGATGSGMAEEVGVSDCIDIQMGTLSKAVGSFGAYAAGSKVLVEYLINNARSFIFSTALPPAVAVASRAALEVVRGEPQRRERVRASSLFLRRELQQAGFDVPSGFTPIIPVLAGDAVRAQRWSKILLESGIFISAIRPPTVPAGTARLRVTVTAAHTDSDLARCIEAFKRIKHYE
jgi:glycine C-acetyltransferase